MSAKMERAARVRKATAWEASIAEWQHVCNVSEEYPFAGYQLRLADNTEMCLA
jgi:hypothetical protein